MPRRGEQLVAELLVQAVLAALQRRYGVGVERDRQPCAAPVQHGNEPDPAHVLAHGRFVGASAGAFLMEIKSAPLAGPIVAA